MTTTPYFCEHGVNLIDKDCRKCDDNDRDRFARSLSSLNNDNFRAAMEQYDRDNDRKDY